MKDTYTHMHIAFLYTQVLLLTGANCLERELPLRELPTARTPASAPRARGHTHTHMHIIHLYMAF
jgi:hypothetical protein